MIDRLTLHCFSLDEYTEEQKRILVASCPTTVFNYEETTGAVVVQNASACIYCRDCLYTIEDFRRSPEDRLGVEIIHSADKFTFTVETNGCLTAQQVVTSALAELAAKLKRIQTGTSQLSL